VVSSKDGVGLKEAGGADGNVKWQNWLLISSKRVNGLESVFVCVDECVWECEAARADQSAQGLFKQLSYPLVLCHINVCLGVHLQVCGYMSCLCVIMRAGSFILQRPFAWVIPFSLKWKTITSSTFRFISFVQFNKCPFLPKKKHALRKKKEGLSLYDRRNDRGG